MASIYDELGAIAADPQTDWDTLHWIAENYPELRPAVAENPSAYPELLDALGSIGDPEIDSALARRRSQAPASVNPATATGSAKQAGPPAPTGPAAPANAGGPVSSARGGSSSWWIATPDGVTSTPSVETTSDEEQDSFGSRPSDSVPSAAAAHGTTRRPSTTPPPRRRPSTRRLVLALVLPLIALAAVGAVVFALLDVNQGASTATEATAPASSSAQQDVAEESTGAEGADSEDSDPEGSDAEDGAASATTEPPTTQELRARVASLPEESSCDSVAEDATTFAEFGSAVTEDGGVEPADSSLVQEALLGLQESCGSVHAAALYLGLRGDAEQDPALASTAQQMGSAWIQTPFPAQGQPLESFAAPGGNVVCELGDALRCTVLEHSFAAPEGCTDGVTYSIEVDRPAEPACGDPVQPAGQPVLGYGQTASNEFFACSSFQSQMSCWNQLTGEGINLSASRNATY